jgi:hypothetical protein
LSSLARRCQLLAIAAAFALACASTPESVERARENLRAAEGDPAVTKGASIELEQARKAVERLEEAADGDAGDEELDHLAYIADQKIEIARVAASEAEIRRQVKELTEKREALRARAHGAKKARETGRVQSQQIQVETVQ